MATSTLNGLTLLGWKTRDEALRLLQEHCGFDPPVADRNAEALWARYRERVNQLKGRRLGNPEFLPMTADEQRVADQFVADSQTRGVAIRRIVKVDPRSLVVHQLEIIVDRSTEMAERVSTGQEWAAQQLSPARLDVRQAVRHSPNAIDIDLPHGEWGLLFDPAKGFIVAEASRHVNVSPIASQLALWAGYHRAYASAAFAPPCQRTILAALTEDASTGIASGLRTSGIRAAMSDNPPVFDDFFNPDLALAVPFRAKRFTMEIRARVVAANL